MTASQEGGSSTTTQTWLHKAARFVTLNLGGVSLVGGGSAGGVLHDNDDTYMTPLGRFDTVALGLKTREIDLKMCFASTSD